MSDKNKKRMDHVIKIVLVIIIIILLIHNCELVKRRNGNNVPTGNVDIIEIKCDKENTCTDPSKNDSGNKKIESLKFSQNKISIRKGDTQELIVIVTPSELSNSKLTWKSSDTSVVTVDANGKIKGIKTGRATITATSSNGKKATCTVEVVNDEIKVQKITLTPNNSSIEIGKMTQISVVIEPENATNRDLVWTSNDTSIATVDSKGVVKGIKNGTVTITAKTKDGKVVGSTNITVNTTSKQIENLKFSQNKVSVKKGDTQELIVIVTPSELSNSKLTWKSSDTSVVTVDENGKIKGIETGKATITVTSSNGKKATCTVEVVNDDIKVQKIKLTPIKSSIDVADMTQISVVIEPENATNRDLVWTSSDPSIATVDSKGVVKGIKKGTVTITAKTKDGKVVGSTNITVNTTSKQIENLKFSQNKVSVKKGDTQELIVIVTPSELSNSKLNWKSSDTSVVTVDANGKIKGINTGKATITVTSSNGKKATCTVEVVNDDIKVQKITLTPNNSSIEVEEMTQISVVIEPENATNRDLVWTSNDTSIATVDSKGVVKGIKKGTVTITAKTKDGKVIGSTTITVKENEPDGEFIVEDKDIRWNGQVDAKIFTNPMYKIEGVVAPEDSNTYQFVVRNSTRYKLKYSISFIESNPYNINMKYKLKKNDTYIIDHYVSASELNIADYLLNIGSNDTYYLEWKWVSSSNDTKVGKTPNAKYDLKIEVKAEGTND